MKQQLGNYLLMVLLLVLIAQMGTAMDCKPFGVRINLGLSYINLSNPQKLGIRFDTHQPCIKSYVTITKEDSSIRKLYCDNQRLAFDNYSSNIHKCSIVDLEQGQTISYMVFGWTGNISDAQIPFANTPISYTLPKNNEPFKFVSVADWSYLRQFRTKYKPLDDSFDYLLKTDNTIKALFINGDVAYDLQSNNGRNYEDFLNMISQVTTKWPVILNPGNHEHRDSNLRILNTSFETYGLTQKRVCLLKLPLFNLILFDPYQILYNKQPQNVSYEAYRKILDQSYNQKALTVLGSHYPYRCNGEEKDCVNKHQQMSQFFKAMFQINAPLYLGAHQHAYQRIYPFKSDGTFVKTSQVEWNPYLKDNQRRLISVVEGVAGNDLSLVQSYEQLQDFTASVSYNVTGYGIMSVGETKLIYSHYTTNDANRPTDTFQIRLKRTSKLQLRTQ